MHSEEGQRRQLHRGRLARFESAAASYSRRYLLPSSIISVFGHTTRLQVLVLAILSCYLLVWTFVE